jgi:O-antigen/teichoic acid export membrane protein
MGERTHKSILNAEVNLIFYFLTLFLSFFSRKVFLSNLGVEFIGLYGTLSNILGYLNLAELGIAGCVSFFLFKPLQTNNHNKIQEILSVFGYLYRIIGYCIFIGGIIISSFFPFIFRGTELSFGIIYFAFYSILFSSLIGYFINYRQILLSADQKNYIVAIYFQTSTIVKTLIQIYLAYTYKNLYVWVSIEFLFSIIGCIILNWKINQVYPWLTTNKSSGKKLLKKYPELLTNTRQIFIHKIKDFLLNKSDELFIFLFVTLKMVAIYGNYTLLVTKIGQLFGSVLNSVDASIGNLVAEGNKENIMKVFWELISIRHFVAGILCFSVFHFIEPFISLWLGVEYLIDHKILVFLTVYSYISYSRQVIDMYNHAYGLYADTWAAWTELLINISITIIAGYFYGIIGLLLGKIISTGIIIVFWKPYYLFTKGLKEQYSLYWKGAIRNWSVSAFCFYIGHIFIKEIPLKADKSYTEWIIFCSLSILLYLSINIPVSILFCKGAKSSISRLPLRRIVK